MNSIEQFCINFTNEKLQNLYITYVFENEKTIFEKEGLTEFLGTVNFTDNKQIIELMDKSKNPPGVFQSLDDNTFPHPSDENFLNAIERNHKKNPCFIETRLQKDPHNKIFRLEHSAKRVSYTITNFTEKDMDRLPPGLFQVMLEGDPNFALVLENKIDPNQEVEPEDPDGKDRFLGYKFRTQMGELMSE